MHPGPVGESQSNSQDGVATLLRHPTETLGNHPTSLGLPSSSGLCLFNARACGPVRALRVPPSRVSSVDDRRISRTSTATPAEPGELLFWFSLHTRLDQRLEH